MLRTDSGSGLTEGQFVVHYLIARSRGDVRVARGGRAERE